MSDKETEELRSQVAELRTELAAVSQNRESILREKRELQDKLRSQSLMDAADRQIRRDRGEKVETPAASDAAYTLTAEEARDPARYRAAREAARQAGYKNGPIIVASTIPAGPDKGDVRTIRTGSTIYVRQDVGQDIRQYRRFREEAAQEGKALRMFHDRANLAAISDRDPDALTYFDRIASGDASPLVRENAG